MKKLWKRVLAGAMTVLLAACSEIPANAMSIYIDAPPRAEVELVRHDGPGWYHGYRGYRHWRHGYRRHDDGWWYPMAAFTAGALVGSALASQSHATPIVEALPAAHVDWCYSRYKTYRASDNTYVPRVGVRAQCYSPYY